MVKVNFGSGPYPIDGWINVDMDADVRPQVVADLRRGIPFAARSIDYIRTEDFVAALDPTELRAFLTECRRILKPDGAMRVLTPDLARFARMYLEEPEKLVRIWNDSVGVPLTTKTACEVFNLGMQLAGRFQYDSTTFASIAATAGFETTVVDYNRGNFSEMGTFDLRKRDESVSMYLECVPRR